MAVQKVLCLTLLSFLVSSIKCGEDTKNFAVELDADTFEPAIKNKNHFVMFYAPWCSHCNHLHPLWEQLAELMNVKDEAKVIIAKVDCTQHQSLCGQHEVTGYPTLRLFKLGEAESVRFKGTRDMPSITDFINQHLNTVEENEISQTPEQTTEAPANTLVELTEHNFAKHVSSGNHFVKFYAPWCSHCQRLAPTWEELAETLKHQTAVSIAKIDCTVYRPLCQDFEVKGYPTLLWIEDGKKIEKYSGSRDHDSLKVYVEKMLGADAKQNIEVINVTEEPKIVKNAVIQVLGQDEFQQTISEGVAFVKFYAPGCSHCQKMSPTWDQLAEKLHTGRKTDVKVAKVDCTAAENKSTCVSQEVDGYPTLYAYKDGERQSEYDGSRSLPELQHYISKFVDGHDEL